MKPYIVFAHRSAVVVRALENGVLEVVRFAQQLEYGSSLRQRLLGLANRELDASCVAFTIMSARGATSPRTAHSSVNCNAPGTTSHMQHAGPR